MFRLQKRDLFKTKKEKKTKQNKQYKKINIEYLYKKKKKPMLCLPKKTRKKEREIDEKLKPD